VTIRSRRVDGQPSTFELLRRIADRSSLRPALERWLDTVERERRHQAFDHFEEVTLGPLDRLLHREDICDIFPELDALAKEIRSRARWRI
jgi:hypothetical protein